MLIGGIEAGGTKFVCAGDEARKTICHDKTEFRKAVEWIFNNSCFGTNYRGTGTW